MDSCYYCGVETDIPFTCNYCKDNFCSEHRLPEMHRCVKLHTIRAKRFGEKNVIRGKGRKGLFSRIFRR
ncbi:MAG: nucleotide-binding protein [Candidatus Nitrosothermus koennekii]|nr:MAG: nucleotide-binding protein [Candidatus Nitrosothermus koennekii]